MITKQVRVNALRGLRARASTVHFVGGTLPFSNHRPLHTTPPLLSSAASLLQDSIDNDDLSVFVSSHGQDLLDSTANDAVQRRRFDKTNPHEALEEVENALETEAILESTKKYEKILSAARDRQDYASLTIVQRLVLEWYQPLKDSIKEEQDLFVSGTKNKRKTMNTYGHHLCALTPEKLAIIVAHEAILHCLNHSTNTGLGATFMSTAFRIGEVIETEINVQRAIEKRILESQASSRSGSELSDAIDHFLEEDEFDDDFDNFDDSSELQLQQADWMYTAHHRQLFMDEITRHSENKSIENRISYANRRARLMFQAEEEWSKGTRLQLGAALLDRLLQSADIKGTRGETEKAFTYHKAWIDNKLFGHILMNEMLFRKITQDPFEQRGDSTNRHMPMVVPPRPWLGPNDGAYKQLKVQIMRTRDSMIQKDALNNADLSMVFDGLNVLGQIPWKINRHILDVAEECWRSGIALGDLPTHVDYELPTGPPVRPPVDKELFKDRTSEAFLAQNKEYRQYKEALAKYARIRQRNMDLRSLRCSAMLKLEQAAKFKDFEQIYFPYNMDFRGRVYPIPPHLSNVGSDLCRGLLTFANSKKLGKRGFYWLKVHLANLAGKDKISFDERAAFTEQNMENIRAAVEDPLGENRWWMGLEDPFQGLATCHEIINAVDSGDPETYETSLPVHMDGSCNGLQHYAALGRDTVGGKAVNLCNEDLPQDVYSGVMREVIRIVAEEATKQLEFDEFSETLNKKEKAILTNHRSARLVNGLIDRGVVKRTVMTSVYGVTLVGARTQIQEKIEEKLTDKGMDVHEMQIEIRQACLYLAKVTMDAMGQLFSGARETMTWLTKCARLISKQGQPVAFVSPMGVPVIQPYRRPKPHTVVTLLQTVVLTDRSDDLPVHRQRQVSAFPPNYVHSLDSSHMILTALEMDRRGLSFSAVHDSFWTHPCDIDEMNEVLRDCFVELYEQPLLENLKKSWELRYPGVSFPDLPQRGDLNLNDVRSAKYFFQ